MNAKTVRSLVMDGRPNPGWPTHVSRSEDWGFGGSESRTMTLYTSIAVPRPPPRLRSEELAMTSEVQFPDIVQCAAFAWLTGIALALPDTVTAVFPIRRTALPELSLVEPASGTKR